MVDIEEAQPFELQVAGHDGVLSVEGNKMIIKPLNETEQEFYEKAAAHLQFNSFLPQYYGTLQRTSQGSDASQLPVHPTYICLENVASGFSKPCVIDIKLGTRLYGNDATAEKRERMERKARETTSAALGVRICGMKVHGAPPADRDWCRGLTGETITDAFERFFAAVAEDPEFRKYIIDQFVVELEELVQAVKEVETRMYASSVLLVYDADTERKKGFFEETSDGDDDVALLDMRAIDFAHSRWVPGNGYDQGYVFGVESLIGILHKLTSP